MGYTVPFPANQVGQQVNVWDMRDYGWIEVWVIGDLTVGAQILPPQGYQQNAFISGMCVLGSLYDWAMYHSHY